MDRGAARVRRGDVGRLAVRGHSHRSPHSLPTTLDGTETVAVRPYLLTGALHGELRFLAERLTEALADALRVAESRGRRLRGLN
ncbi:hypothetical protein [Streptomyces sp. MH13]|uniref:hypothetical protein n=1 Tax=Streptomyces sp. MH13 TaxID=3417651 RepID=UPI003CFB1934